MLDFEKEALLHMIVVDDRIAERLGIHDDRAYLRAFILKDRATGEVRCLYRFHQMDGKSWAEIRHPEPAYLLNAVQQVFSQTTHLFAPEIQHPVTTFTPPSPDLSADDTLVWLIEKDLVEIVDISVAEAT